MNRPHRHVRFVQARLESAGVPERCAAQVELRGAANTYVGEAQDGCADGPGLRCVAEAAAHALHPLGHGLDIEDVEMIQALGQPAVVVRVRARYEDDQRTLHGFCLIQDDPARATTLAVLNAVNRFLDVG
ncbi:MAG TPA: hypothetical protein VD793_02010 [Gemmatimonadales bacterium]|nr:hypothetical protein [Gemmatimonadales bacterium]